MGICSILMVAALLSGPCLTVGSVVGRGRRSDDAGALELVLNNLAMQVQQLTGDSDAQASVITQLQNRLDAIEAPIGFTVKFVHSDVSHLGAGQTLKFDNVIFNAGNGYNPHTGVFTAPAAGTYVFYMNIAKHTTDTSCIQMDLVHGRTWLLTADACGHSLNTGSNMALQHLQAGDTVSVQMRTGHDIHGDYHTTFSGMKLTPV